MLRRGTTFAKDVGVYCFHRSLSKVAHSRLLSMNKSAPRTSISSSRRARNRNHGDIAQSTSMASIQPVRPDSRAADNLCPWFLQYRPLYIALMPNQSRLSPTTVKPATRGSRRHVDDCCRTIDDPSIHHCFRLRGRLLASNDRPFFSALKNSS
jgi:hypothetical protein